jgi:hypothetical protein
MQDIIIAEICLATFRIEFLFLNLLVRRVALKWKATLEKMLAFNAPENLAGFFCVGGRRIWGGRRGGKRKKFLLIIIRSENEILSLGRGKLPFSKGMGFSQHTKIIKS